MGEQYDPGTEIVETPHGRLRRLATSDGEPHRSYGRTFEWELECPGCGVWGLLDEDQLHGRVSVDHSADGCSGGYHETHNFAEHLEAV
jgi:hypothetical protein